MISSNWNRREMIRNSVRIAGGAALAGLSGRSAKAFHLTHFVDVGAKALDVTGTCDDALGFKNPDGSCVLLMRNELSHSQLVQVQVGNRALQ